METVEGFTIERTHGDKRGTWNTLEHARIDWNSKRYLNYIQQSRLTSKRMPHSGTMGHLDGTPPLCFRSVKTQREINLH